MNTELPALRLANVTKAFGSIPVIQNVNLDIRVGERHAVIGPNEIGRAHV